MMKWPGFITHWYKGMLVAGACLLNAGNGFAQKYPFYNVNVDDGLIQSQATCLAQDRWGNLWVGTLGGVSRFDGRNFTNYNVRNGLLSNTVWSIAADSSGDIWIGTQAGLMQFNGKKFAHYNLPKQPLRVVNNTQQIETAKDTTWWRVQGDIYYITQGKINIYATPGADGYVSAMKLERDGMWLAKDGVVYHRQAGKWDSLRFDLPADQRPPTVFRLYQDKAGTMWVTTNMGLYKVDQGKIVVHTINGTPLNFLPGISAITQDRNGALWLATANGVVKTGENMLQYYNKRNGLSDNAFFDIITDAEGNVWMASDGQGIYRYSGTQFTVLDESMGLLSTQVMAVTTNRRDSLILGTYDAGLFVFKDGKVSPLAFPSNPVPAITSLYYTHKGKLWIGTRGKGLWSYERNIFRQYEAPDRNFPSNYINSLYGDTSGRIWIGFANGAILLQHDSFKTVPVLKTSVTSFLNIGDDSVLIASDAGLHLYHAGDVQPYKTGTGIDTAKVQCFIIQGRNLWLGSSDNGLFRYNMDSHQVLAINKVAGLRSDFIYNLVSDDDGNIWAGTGFGIHKIRIGTGDDVHITFYGKAQGITGMESNINAVLKLADGSIWFGTTNGALHYQPHTAVVSSAPTSIVLQSVKLTGEAGIDPSYTDSLDNWYGIPYHLRLPYKKNNISFSFQAVTLNGAQQVLYRYRLDGLETPWSDWSSTNSVTYSALPPGKYTFRVQCQAGEGQNNPELAYAFEIITPFQKTSWFRFAVLAACILIGILLQYIASSRKARREKLLARLRAEEQTKIRMRTAEDFHDEIGNKLTRINVLTNVLKSKINVTPEADRILTQIQENTGQLYGGTRDILWSLKPSNDNLYEILNRIRDFGIELFQDTEVNFDFTGDDDKWSKFRLPMDMSRNLIMIWKEALNNALKYSQAKNVTIEVSIKHKNVLQMVLKDDGTGFDTQTVKRGNGLANMTTRAERLNGRLYIDTRQGKGTIISLAFKIPQNR